MKVIRALGSDTPFGIALHLERHDLRNTHEEAAFIKEAYAIQTATEEISHATLEIDDTQEEYGTLSFSPVRLPSLLI